MNTTPSTPSYTPPEDTILEGLKGKIPREQIIEKLTQITHVEGVQEFERLLPKLLKHPDQGDSASEMQYVSQARARLVGFLRKGIQQEVRDAIALMGTELDEAQQQQKLADRMKECESELGKKFDEKKVPYEMATSEALEACSDNADQNGEVKRLAMEFAKRYVACVTLAEMCLSALNSDNEAVIDEVIARRPDEIDGDEANVIGEQPPTRVDDSRDTLPVTPELIASLKPPKVDPSEVDTAIDFQEEDPSGDSPTTEG